MIKKTRKTLTHRAYTSTKATTLTEIKPRRPFSAEIPEDDGVPEDEGVGEHIAVNAASVLVFGRGVVLV